MSLQRHALTLRTCACVQERGRHPLYLCPHCACSGLAEVETDTTGSAYVAGAATLQEVLARILEVIGSEDQACRLAVRHGDRESAIVCAARRSGMAEIAAGLQGYLSRPPRLPRGRVVT